MTSITNNRSPPSMSNSMLHQGSTRGVHPLSGSVNSKPTNPAPTWPHDRAHGHKPGPSSARPAPTGDYQVARTANIHAGVANAPAITFQGTTAPQSGGSGGKPMSCTNKPGTTATLADVLAVAADAIADGDLQPQDAPSPPLTNMTPSDAAREVAAAAVALTSEAAASPHATPASPPQAEPRHVQQASATAAATQHRALTHRQVVVQHSSPFTHGHMAPSSSSSSASSLSTPTTHTLPYHSQPLVQGVAWRGHGGGGVSPTQPWAQPHAPFGHAMGPHQAQQQQQHTKSWPSIGFGYTNAASSMPAVSNGVNAAAAPRAVTVTAAAGHPRGMSYNTHMEMMQLQQVYWQTQMMRDAMMRQRAVADAAARAAGQGIPTALHPASSLVKPPSTFPSTTGAVAPHPPSAPPLTSSSGGGAATTTTATGMAGGVGDGNSRPTKRARVAPPPAGTSSVPTPPPGATSSQSNFTSPHHLTHGVRSRPQLTVDVTRPAGTRPAGSANSANSAYSLQSHSPNHHTMFPLPHAAHPSTSMPPLPPSSLNTHVPAQAFNPTPGALAPLGLLTRMGPAAAMALTSGNFVPPPPAPPAQPMGTFPGAAFQWPPSPMGSPPGASAPPHAGMVARRQHPPPEVVGDTAENGAPDVREQRYRTRLVEEFGDIIVPVNARTVWCTMCNKTLSLGDEYGISNARVHYRRMHGSDGVEDTAQHAESLKRKRDAAVAEALARSDPSSSAASAAAVAMACMASGVTPADVAVGSGVFNRSMVASARGPDLATAMSVMACAPRRGRRPKALAERAEAFRGRLRSQFGAQFVYLTPRAVHCTLCPRRLALSGDFRMSNLRVHNRHKHKGVVVPAPAAASGSTVVVHVGSASTVATASNVVRGSPTAPLP